MNYRHGYHAGNFADVLKHIVLVALIGHLRKKETPFFVLDTHAGAGSHDLAGEQAKKTNEAEGGILKLMAANGPPVAGIEGFLGCVRAANHGLDGLRFYPGSPLIARMLLRPQDRMAAVELHPEEARALKAAFAGDKQVGVHAADGYEALRAHLPPKEKRGLVLIDPPYEQPDEFRQLVKALPGALTRWSTGIFAIWYPIKSVSEIDRFHDELVALGKSVLVAELFIHEPDDETRLNGAGIAIINPPWKLDEELAAVLPELARRLGAQGGTRVVTLASENAL